MKRGDKTQLNNFGAHGGGILYSVMVVCALFCSLIYSFITVKFEFSSAVLSYVIGPVSILLALGVTILSLRLKTKEKVNPFKELMPIKFKLFPSLATALIFIGLTFGLANLNVYFATWLESLGVTINSPEVPADKTPLNIILIILTACLLPAFFEELAFRGVIVNSLSGTGKVFAILFGGFVFALFHMSPVQTLYQFACGAVYTLIILYGGNFILTFIIHFLNNLFVILNHYYFGIETTVWLTVVGLVCLGGGIALLILKGSPVSCDKTKSKGDIKAFIITSLVGIALALFIWIQGLIL